MCISQLGDFAGKGMVGGREARPSGKLAGNRVMYSAPTEPKSLERDNGGLSSWRGDEKDTRPQSWPQLLVSVDGPRKRNQFPVLEMKMSVSFTWRQTWKDTGGPRGREEQERNACYRLLRSVRSCPSTSNFIC